MTCANCPMDAVYYVDDPGANPLAFCRMCLPEHLSERANLGQFDTFPATDSKTKK